MKQEHVLNIKKLIPEERVRETEFLKDHTTFKVGGPASLFLEINTVEELKEVLSFIYNEEIPYFIIGNGSNLLVSDSGFNGVVVKLAGSFKEVSVNEERITAGAAALVSKVCAEARDNSLTGLEFAFGIPGTIGGAMVMNAGAYDGEMSFVVESVKLLNEDLEVVAFSKDEMEFSYRDSILKRENLVVLETTFKLEKGRHDDIDSKMSDFMERRKSKQPLEFPSAGSTFKRPEGNFAGKLIMEAGLSGYTVGGAKVSTKHCGFVVNDANGTATDINKVIMDVQAEVKRQTGIMLEPEVIRIGSFN